MIGSMFRKAWYSDSATLNLDFTTGVLDPRLTFTRSSTGTYIDSSGYVASASIDAPRFDHDPTTLAPRGLLIEGQATNLARSSADFTNATYWTQQTAYSSTSNTAGPSPDGTNNASSFTEPSTSLQRSIYQSYSSAAGTYTGSVWAKLSSGSTRYIRLVVSSGSADFGYVTVNINTGAVQQTATAVGTATSASATVTAYPSGWYRITLTVTLASSINFMFAVPMDFSSIDTPTTNYGRVVYLGDGSVFLLWGAQMEASAFASSYIATTTSTATRDPDNCVMTGTDFSSWFNASEGTFFAEYKGVPSGSTSGFVWYVNDGTGDQRMFLSNASGSPRNQVTNIAVTQCSLTHSASMTVDGKNAFAYANNDFAASHNGASVLTDVAGTIPIVDRCAIGFSGVATYINTAIAGIKYWPTRLPDATLQSLTT